MKTRPKAIEAAAADWVLRRERGLTPAERQAFEAWRTADERHADAWQRHHAAWSMLDRPRNIGVADGMMGELRRRAARRRRRAACLSAAAALAFAVALAWKFRPTAGLGQHPAVAASAAQETRILPDGSKVELPHGASIAVDFDRAFRRVELQHGDALFQVAKNRQWPFVVSALGIEVQAVGTAFSIKLSGASVEVTVTDGRVRITRALPGLETGKPDAGTAIFLGAGNRLVLDTAEKGGIAAAAGAVTSLDSPPGPRQPARFDFSDTPLAEAAALMNRNSSIRLLIDDPALAATRVNGSFRSDDSDTFVRLLEANFGVVAERSDHTLKLRRAQP